MKPVNNNNTQKGEKNSSIQRGTPIMTQTQLERIRNLLERMTENRQRMMQAGVGVLSSGVISEEYTEAARDSQHELFALPNSIESIVIPTH